MNAELSPLKNGEHNSESVSTFDHDLNPLKCKTSELSCIQFTEFYLLHKICVIPINLFQFNDVTTQWDCLRGKPCNRWLITSPYIHTNGAVSFVENSLVLSQIGGVVKPAVSKETQSLRLYVEMKRMNQLRQKSCQLFHVS